MTLKKLSVLLPLVAMLFGVFLAAPSGAGAASAPTLKIKPHRVHVNHVIKVRATGMLPNTTIYIVECKALTSQSDCDLNNYVTKTSNANGVVRARIVARNTVCQVGKKCYFVASDAMQTHHAAKRFKLRP